MKTLLFLRSLVGVSFLFAAVSSPAAELRAGAARTDITDRSGPVNDPLFAKALVLQSEGTTMVLVTIDAVAIGEIGRIGHDFLPAVREQLKKELGIPPESILINASHCHGIVRPDLLALTVQTVKEAWKAMTPVKAGVGVTHEDRISENRRIKLKDGSEVDMRRAYSMPRDEDVASVAPIDPQVGLLRLDRENGEPLAVIYHFACHPIMNPPWKGNSADFPGYASKLIETSLGGKATAFFVQGCGGDINPVGYKEVNTIPDAEPLGNLLGLNVVQAVQKIETKAGAPLKISREMMTLPRGADLAKRMAVIQTEQARLLASLKPTNINFKTFLPLLLEQKLSPEYASQYAQSYRHEQALGRDRIAKLDADNKGNVEAYLANIATMERLTRLNTNFALLKKHLAQNEAAAKPEIDVEICGLRIGDFKMVTFPGELTSPVGLRIKKSANDPYAFVAGYTNGYIYYLPTVEQRLNSGYAQEDCDSIVAPEWQEKFEKKALEILRGL